MRDRILKSMKSILLSCLVLSAVSPLAAAVTLIDLGGATLPFDGELHLNVVTGETRSSLDFSEFNAAPWISFYSGGAVIASSDYVGVWTNQVSNYDGSTAGHFFQNVTFGSTVDAGGVSGSAGSFTEGEAASEFHMDNGAGSFTSGETGYLAFSYLTTPGGDVAYGWLRFAPEISGSGVLVDYAFSDTPGEAVTVGVIPEPASFAALAGAMAIGFAAYRRRRGAVSN